MATYYYNFSQMHSAKEAVQALKQQGFTNARLDLYDASQNQTNALAFSYKRSHPSLSSMVLGKNAYMYTLGTGPLTASDTCVNGLSSFECREVRSILAIDVEDMQKSVVDGIIGLYLEL